MRWYLPKERVLKRYLDPDLTNQERDETQKAMEVFLRADDEDWGAEDWGGIMCGVSRTGLDVSTAQSVEIWINDATPDINLRAGRVHIDFGFISEDGFWPIDAGGNLVVGTQQREDGEDLNGDAYLNTINGYLTTTIDLKETPAVEDVVADYDDVQELVDSNISWRKYRIPIDDFDQVANGWTANIEAVTHARIWFESGSPGLAKTTVILQFSEFRFVGEPK